MDEKYNIVYLEQPEWGVIGGGINEFNRREAGDENFQHLCFVLRAPDQEVAGGVIGATFWDWLHIDLMWVQEGLRRRGFGSQLLKLAEDEARKRGARQAFLDTFSFQAPEFYQKHGYRVFGELSDFPHGHQRVFLTKLL